jgi:hypothetical protein
MALPVEDVRTEPSIAWRGVVAMKSIKRHGFDFLFAGIEQSINLTARV